MKHTQVMEKIDRKFMSSNSIPVSHAMITRDEYEVIKDIQARLESGLASLYKLVEENINNPDKADRLKIELAKAAEAYGWLNGNDIKNRG